MTVGAFAGPAARVGGPWQAIVPADATAGLRLAALGHAWIYRSGRRRPSLRQAALVPIAPWCEWRRPRDRIILAWRRTMVFGRARPAIWRLLVTKLVVPIGREQVLAVVGALVPVLAARLVRSALGAVVPERIGSRRASLIAARIAELIGSRRANLIGSRVMWPAGARVSWLTCARVPWLTGLGIPWLAGAGIPELAGTRILGLSGAWILGLSGAWPARLVTAGIPELTGPWV